MNNKSAKAWNPRFIAYSRAHNKTPTNMLRHDKRKYPGGCMTGFTLWIRVKLREFFEINPEAFLDRHHLYNGQAFTEFLQIRE